MSMRNERLRSNLHFRVVTERDKRAGSLVFGTMLMLAGTLLLLGRLDIIDMGPVTGLWPLALVGLGISKLWQSWGSADSGSGVWLLITGLWFLGVNFRFLGLTYRNSWPLLLIAAGLAMVLRSFMANQPVSPGGAPPKDARTTEVSDGR